MAYSTFAVGSASTILTSLSAGGAVPSVLDWGRVVGKVQPKIGTTRVTHP